jgi:hypothetical protein
MIIRCRILSIDTFSLFGFLQLACTYYNSLHPITCLVLFMLLGFLCGCEFESLFTAKGGSSRCTNV